MDPHKTTTDSKRFSVVMRGIDFNAYRAYKISNQEIKSETKKNPLEILRGEHNLMRFPFGLTEQRFRWQTSKNLGEKCELKGTMVKRKNQSMNSSLVDIIENSNTVPERRSSLTNKASYHKYQENKNSVRTIQPLLNINDASNFSHRPAKNKVEGFQKSTAVGGIGDLISKTPEYEPVSKKYPGKITQGSDIFTPASGSTVKSKIPVNMEHYKNSKDYAGTKSGIIKEEKASFSRNKQVLAMKSDVFNRTKSDTLSSQGISRKGSCGADIFKSSIVLN